MKNMITRALAHTFVRRAVGAAVLSIFVASAYCEEAKPLTNGIPVLNGLYFAFSDGPWDGPPGAALKDTEVIADRALTWIVHNTSSNQGNSVIYAGLSNSFAFDLTTLDGLPISKTAKGQGMSAGPPASTNLRRNRNIRTRSSGHWDFPAISELFQIPSNGVYIAEIRYWTWIYPQGKFILSDPIRLKVIKQDTNSPPGSAKSLELKKK